MVSKFTLRPWIVKVTSQPLVVIFIFLVLFICNYLTPSLMLETVSTPYPKESCSCNHDGNNGWSTIDVFVGETSSSSPASLLGVPNGRQWFSQKVSKQDQIVTSLMQNKPNGYFVDLASNDAIRLSNTLALERNLQWKGLCIEANPEYWRGLAHRDCQVVAAVVGAKRKQLVQFNLRRTTGGIVGDKFDNKDSTNTVVESFYTVTLLEILERYHAPAVMDYLSLDVEGAELMIMENFPFDQYSFKIMTVERPLKPLRDLLKANNYEFIRVIAPFGETLWINKSFKNEMDLLSLDNFPLITLDMKEKIPDWDEM